MILRWNLQFVNNTRNIIRQCKRIRCARNLRFAWGCARPAAFSLGARRRTLRSAPWWEALPGGGVLPCGGRLSSPPVFGPGAALGFSLSLLRAHNLSLTTAQPCVLIESICGWASLPRRQFEPQHANLATESRTKEQRSNNAQDKLLTKYGASDHCVDCAQDVDWWWVFANIFHSLLFFHFYFRQTWLNLNLL